MDIGNFIQGYINVKLITKLINSFCREDFLISRQLPEIGQFIIIGRFYTNPWFNRQKNTNIKLCLISSNIEKIFIYNAILQIKNAPQIITNQKYPNPACLEFYIC